jgi:hypothetical protein
LGWGGGGVWEGALDVCSFVHKSLLRTDSKNYVYIYCHKIKAEEAEKSVKYGKSDRDKIKKR